MEITAIKSMREKLPSRGRRSLASATSIAALPFILLACGTGDANAPSSGSGGQQTPTAQDQSEEAVPSPGSSYLSGRNRLTREQSSFDSSRSEELELADGRTVRLQSIVPVDAIPAIFEPVYDSAEEADKTYSPDERILGISINGDNRAYSIPLMSRHEIVNDTVGGKKVAITW